MYAHALSKVYGECESSCPLARTKHRQLELMILVLTPERNPTCNPWRQQ
jgi:hypothetical protein